jgi:hypothetical protein
VKVRDVYLEKGNMKVGNGENTSFWDDAWCMVSITIGAPDHRETLHKTSV